MSLIRDFSQVRAWWLFRATNGIIIGEPLPHLYTGRYFPVVYVLAGKVATFHCVTNDESITRKEAIDFCQAIYTGRYKAFDYDLRNV